MKESIFRCPNCKSRLVQEGNSLYCVGARRHCFDIAAQGYVNLTLPNASGAGDDATLIAARRAFLARGFYLPVAQKVRQLLDANCKGGQVLDAGCGEGYYTNLLARAGYRMVGVDLSRRGVRAAAKTAEREGLPAEYAVAGIFSLPLPDAAFDAVISLFAPVAETEFIRILRPGGIILTVGAGADHLFALKQLLYDTPYENKARADEPTALEKVHEESLRFTMELSGKDARNLFAMTPYYYRTPKAGHERLAALETLSCGADVRFAVYRKAGGV